MSISLLLSFLSHSLIVSVSLVPSHPHELTLAGVTTSVDRYVINLLFVWYFYTLDSLNLYSTTLNSPLPLSLRFHETLRLLCTPF